MLPGRKTCSLLLGWALLGLPSAPAQQTAPVPAVDTTNRAQVLALYHDHYLLPAPTAVWTGSLARRDAGTVNDDLLVATLRRVNYFRAMSGLRGDVVFDPAYNAACQQAALMCALAGHISHEPPASWKGYTPTGAAAAMNSNLCVNRSADLGPGAVDAYVADAHDNNTAVGHRRWLFYPAVQVMGAGIVPTQPGGHSGANALWCRPTAAAFTAFNTPDRRSDFFPTLSLPLAKAVSLFDRHPSIAPGGPAPLAWPPAGYVPAALVYPRWSFSYANADFRSARVHVTKNGRPMEVSLERLAYQTNPQGHGQAVGLNTLAWILPSDAAHPGADESYEVRVSNVRVRGEPRDFVYPVVSIDPAAPAPGSSRLLGRNDLAASRVR